MTTQQYDPNNIFSKIIHGDIPVDKIYEDEFAIAIHDKFPAAPIHVLVLPKAEYISFHDFSAHASPDFIAGFMKSIRNTIDVLKLDDETGYRVSMNIGKTGGQTIFHYHVHIISGKNLKDVHIG